GGMSPLSTHFRLMVPSQFVEEMFAQARAALPNECCGLLAGKLEGDEKAVAVRRFPLTNEAASPVLYEAPAQELFAADREMRREGIDIVAIYHSHPTSAAVPSKTDRERNGHGSEVIHF